MKQFYHKRNYQIFFATVEPYIKKNIKIDDKEYQEIKQYIPAELYAKMFLDYNEKKLYNCRYKVCI